MNSDARDLADDGHDFGAAVFAVLSVFTRASGVLIVIPFALTWILDTEWKGFFQRFKPLPWQDILRGIPVLLPAIAFLIWKLSPLGYRFEFVERIFFGRQGFDVIQSFWQWSQAFLLIFTGGNGPTRVYYAIEYGVIIIALASFIMEAKNFIVPAVFGFLLFFFSITSGAAQGMHRYLLAAPTMYVMLARFGKNRLFDRSWTAVSLLLFGMMATLFSSDMWAG